MKFIILIAVLVAGIFLAYKLFYAAPPEGSPNGTADAYLKAAMANDSEKIKSLCEDSAAESAIQTAQQLRGVVSGVMGLQFQAMKTSVPGAEEARMVMISGRMLGIEMKRDPGPAKWKIMSASFSE